MIPLAPLLGAVLGIAWPAQEPPATPTDPTAARVLERFAELPPEEQERIAAEGYQAMLECGHPLAEAAQELEKWAKANGLEEREPEEVRAYEADVYAPALDLRTRVIERDSSTWRRTQRVFLPRGVPDRTAGWQYDYGRDVLLRPRERASAKIRLERLLQGTWPEPDRLQALARAALDHDARRNPAADYFEHAYRDRDGRVFQDVLLWDIWDSGREFEVSDVEAIAWLRLVAGEDELRSPIPKRLHSPIYGRISDSFEEWREYRLLRDALASRFVTPGAEVPIVYSAIQKRLEEAWALHEHDFRAVRDTLRRTDSRQTFFAQVKAMEEAQGDASWQIALDDRLTLAPLAREVVVQTMKFEGLLGIGRRF